MGNYFDKSDSNRRFRSEEGAPRNNRFNREDSTINRKRSGESADNATPDDFSGRSFMKDRRQRGQESYTPREERSPKRAQNQGRQHSFNSNDEDSNRRFNRNERNERSERNGQRGSYSSAGNRANRDENGEPSRHSFNPNFDSHNRPKFGKVVRTRRAKFDFDEEEVNQDRRFNKSRFGRKENDRYLNDESARGRFNKNGRRPSSRKENNYPSYDAEPSMPETMRLNRFISMSGICSRREADELIAQGLVTVNGVVVTELGAKINHNDKVIYNGQQLKGEKKVYILMNKPKGFVTTLEDPNADKTVISLINNACRERVYPVGRLDKNSLGVLLITNDGDLTKKLTHPSYNKKKVYQVDLNKNISVDDLQKIYNGVELEDGVVEVDDVQYISDSKQKVGIEIHSGRNRVVRRLFEALGYSVVKLDRVYFAGLTKKNLPRGRWRFLTDAEVSMLKSGSYE